MAPPAVMARFQFFRPVILARHRHTLPYAAVVLAGDFEEAGDGGRRHVQAGDVLVHGPYEAHLDRFGRRGATLLNLPWKGPATGQVHWHIGNVEGLSRLARRDPESAAHWLATEARPAAASPGADWPDLLARELSGEFRGRIGAWAAGQRLHPSAVSRGFRQVFGVGPLRFRAEARARAAWQRAASEEVPLAAIAAELGFADQAHLTRAVRRLTGLPPSHWRPGRSNAFKTASASPR